jgi:hypothetical protein
VPTNTFIVDRSLGAVPVSRLLDVRARLRFEGTFEKDISTAGDRPVLSGDQVLQPNTLYPSEKNASVRYYLPQYRVSVDGAGRPAVELRFKAEPDGEIGRLTITLTWTPPQAPGLDVRPIDAVTVPTLGYRVPVQAQGESASAGGWERSTALQPLQVAGPLLAQSTTIFTDKALFDSVYQALSKREQGATLDLLIRARVGVRTWKQVVVGQPERSKILQYRGALFTDMLHKESVGTIGAVPNSGPARVRIAAPPPEMAIRVNAVRAEMLAPAAVATPAPSTAVASPHFAAVAARPMMARPMIMRAAVEGAARPAGVGVAPAAGTRMHAVRPVGAAARLATPAAARPEAAQPQMSRVVLSRVNTPNLAKAVSTSDLKIAGRNAVPLRVALDTRKQPAIVDADLDNNQKLPFTFDPLQPVNSGVFVAEGYTSAIHLLVPLTLVGPDRSIHTVYRDSLMRDVIHMPPSGFRLERDEAAPFLPALSFLASDFSTTDNDEEADVLFRVVANYRLEPWLDPDIVELARAELAKESLVAHFTTGTANDAKLSLDLDLLGDGQVRAGATVDALTGITDTLDLDHQTFVRLWRERLSSGGVNGWVDYRLFDGSPTRVPVRLSLRETSAELFSTTFVGPVPEQPGRYRVTVRNRVESPARITGLPGELLPGGGVAQPVDAGSLVNQLLEPQETRQIDYEVTGTTAPIVDFTPSVLGDAEPNLSALLRLLMITRGYSSLGFTVPVKAAQGTFTPAAGAEPLTGLLVEFDDGTRANLTPGRDQIEVTVVGRLIDQILGTADDSQRYFFRVTNLHAGGEGARTSWIEGHGSAPLEVGSAVVKFDF